MLYINGFVSTSSTNKWKFFLQITNLFSNYWHKTEKYSYEERGVNIDQSAMCYISMDLSRQALYKLVERFFNFQIRLVVD